ncbi:MAG: hypothetical protein ACYCOU_00245 [Sulfobacillus sp.]
MCPVCGYMLGAIGQYDICPCCGTEFDVSDLSASHAELRTAWMAGGCQWWGKHEPIPRMWNPYEQLNRLIESGKPKCG